MDENASGNIVDQTGNISDAHVSYHLETSSSMSEKKTVSFKDGVVGEAMVMDGYSTYAEIPYSELLIGGQYLSISAWIAPRAYNYEAVDDDGDTIQAIVSQYFRDDSYASGFTFGYRREGKPYFGVGLGDEWIYINDGINRLDQYQWNHLSATFDGVKGEMAIYVNGRISNSKSFDAGSSIEGTSLPFLLGRNTVSSSSGDCLMGVVSGLLDEVKVYNRALTSAEILASYESGTENGIRKELPYEDVSIQNTLTDDAYKPQYHGGPTEHWMNEPHAPFYYNGKYHLFYQSNQNGPYFNDAQGIAWGHLVSDDMVNWEVQKEAIVPSEGTVAPDGIWSGGSTLDADGNPVLFFTAGDYEHEGLVSNQNIGIARPKDLTDPYLVEWVVDDELAIAQKSGEGRSGEFRDAHVYKDGDDYYLIVGSGDESSTRGTALVYHTNANTPNYFHRWTYEGHLFDYEYSSSTYGTAWELPVLLPLNNENGESSGKFIFAISPAPATTADNNVVYWIGTFDKNTCRFTPDFADPRRMDYGQNIFTGPSGFIDPVSGETTMFSIMQSQRKSSDLSSSGWSHNCGLTRTLYYDESRADLGIKITDNITNIYNETLLSLDNVTVDEVNDALSSFSNDMYRLDLTLEEYTSLDIRARSSSTSEEYTSIYLNENSVGVNTNLNQNNSTLSGGDFTYSPDDGINKLSLYVDRSQIEVLYNEEKTISARSYPKDLNANGLSFSGEAVISHLEITSLDSIFEGVNV